MAFTSAIAGLRLRAFRKCLGAVRVNTVRSTVQYCNTVSRVSYSYR